MPRFITIGYGDRTGYDRTPQPVRDAAHAQDAKLAAEGALIGIAGAVGGLGGVGINLVLRASYKSNQSATAAFWIFMAFYVVAAVITWWFYVRRQTVLTTETTDIVVEPAVTDPIAPAPITDDTAETAEQPKVSTTSGTGTLA